MKKITFIGIFLMTIFNVFGQNSVDSIEIKKGHGTVFQQKGINLTMGQLLNITQKNPAAYKEMEIAKSNRVLSGVLGYIGGGLIGWPLGTALAGGKPEWTLVGVGAGFIVIAIPIASSSVRHAKRAVGIYNNGLKQAELNNVDFKINFTCNGMSIKMRF